MPFVERPDGARIAYDVADLTPPWVEAPPTVVFHHGIGSNADIWWRWLPELADRFRLVRFDVRGVRRSTPPPGPCRPTMAELADDLIAVAAAAGAERFHLVGDSMGGTAVMWTAIHRPQHVETLTVLSGAWRGGRIERAGAWADYIRKHGMDGWSEMMLGERFAPGSLSAEEEAWVRRLQAAERPEAIVGLTRMLLGTEVAADLPKIACPTLLVYPDNSPFIRPELLPDLRACWPGAEPQVIARARHSIASTHAAELARRLRAFIPGGP